MKKHQSAANHMERRQRFAGQQSNCDTTSRTHHQQTHRAAAGRNKRKTRFLHAEVHLPYNIPTYCIASVPAFLRQRKHVLNLRSRCPSRDVQSRLRATLSDHNHKRAQSRSATITSSHNNKHLQSPTRHLSPPTPCRHYRPAQACLVISS